MASNEQSCGFEEQKSWPQLLEMTRCCEEVFSQIQDGVDSEKVLPSVALGIIQQQLYPGNQQVNIPKVLEMRLRQIRNREVRVLVAGEVSAGKSTFLNILMGGKYLPATHGETTKIVCELRHDPTERKATVKFIDLLEEDVTLALPENPDANEWVSVRACIKSKLYNRKMVEKVIIEWPLACIQPYARTFDGRVPDNDDDSDMNQKHMKRQFTAETVASSVDTDQTYPKRPATPNDDTGDEHNDIGSTLPETPDLASRSNSELKPGPKIIYEQKPPDVLNSPTPSQGAASDMLSSIRESRHTTMSTEQGVDGSNGHIRSTEHEEGDDGSFRLTLLDFPGIKDKVEAERFEPVLLSAVSSRAFIFVIDPSISDGVDERRLQALMEEIETALEGEEIELNPDGALFVINKIDIPPQEEIADIRQNIIDKLRQKWPLINENHVINMDARKMLDALTADDTRAVDWLYDLFGRFLRSTARITMEEHCLWMLNFLQTAHAFASTGKQWAGLAESRKKMDDRLRQTHAKALDLYHDISKETEEDINSDTLELLQKMVRETAEALSNTQWTREDIEREFERDDIEWSDIARQIDRKIVDKINEKNVEKVNKLKLQHQKEIGNRFKSHEKQLMEIEQTLHGIVPKATENTAFHGAVTLLLPAAIGGAVRVAPLMTPFMFLAVPLLPIPLLLASVAGEIQYYSNETKREEFKKDKVEILNNRMRDVCKKTRKIRQDSEIFTYIFGESHKMTLIKRINELLEIIRFLLNSSVKETQEHRQVCCEHIIHTIDVYTSHVMHHAIHCTDLKWTMRADGVRKPIGGGGQANVYEASLNGNLVAVKEFHCSFDPGKHDETLAYLLQAYREYFTLRQLSRKVSEYMVKFHGTSLYHDNEALSFRLVLERCLGNLNMLIDGKVCVEGDRTLWFAHHAAECTAGICFLHENNVLHRDIKPENFLLRNVLPNGLYRVVVCDMGCSKLNYQVCTPACDIGTRAYCAPEVRRPFAVHTKAADVYSLGLVFWELAFRRHIHERSHGTALTRRRDMPDDNDIKNIIASCLSPDPQARKSASAIFDSLDKLRTNNRL